MGVCVAFQNELDFRVGHSRQAIEAHSRVIGVFLVVIYSEHVGRDRLLAVGPKSKERHEVVVPTHCEVRGEFI